MANRYANLVGSNKIKDEYAKINAGFDAVQAEMDAVNAELDQKADRAFAQVNGMQAGTKDDALTIAGGPGITVTENPNNKTVIVTATGTATPGPHGSAHLEFGADPIPYATLTEGGLMSAADKQMLSSHGSRHAGGGEDPIPEATTTMSGLMSAEDKAIFENKKSPSFFELYRKRIALQLPLRPPEYDSIISTYNYNYIYPQSFAIDETTNELFIVFSSSGGTNTWQWIAVYDWPSGTHKTTFSAGSGIGEGIYIQHESGTRYLYVRGDTSGSIGKYDITNLPGSLSRLTPTAEFAVDLQAAFTARNGVFYVESNTHPVGVKLRRYLFTVFDSDLMTRLGEVKFNIFHSGDLNEYKDYIPKRQGIAAGDGYFVAAYGGIYQGGTKTNEMIQGIMLMDGSGKPRMHCLLDPQKMMDVLVANGVNCSRIENEGAFVTSDNRIYTLYVTVGAETASSDGIVIFEELSNAPDSIDFRSAAFNPVSFPDTDSYWPNRIQGNNIYNPITGQKFQSLNEIMDFMVATDCRTFDFYTSSAGTITDINGVNLPGSSHISIFNMNNNTFFYSIRSVSKNEYYLVNGSPRVQTKAMFPAEFRPATSGDPVTNGDLIIVKTSDTQLTFKVRGSDGVVRSASLTLS